MPLRWKSALHRYTDVRNTPPWLFGRNSQMSTYVSLTQESCCCGKKPFSHPGTLQRYQIKCCRIYTCLEGAGLKTAAVEDISETRGGTGDPLTDQVLGDLSLRCLLPVETSASVRNSEPPSAPRRAFLAPPWRSKWRRAQGTRDQLNAPHPALFLTCTTSKVGSYYL